MVELSSKFGALPGEAVDLIAFAHNNDLVVEGLSFHVGSQCTNPQNYIQALHLCAGIFAEAKSRGFELKLLDIGGGFPAHYDETVPAFKSLARTINHEIDRLFPRPIEILAEPGRFLVASAATAVSKIIGKAVRGGKLCYYVDDGVYHTFSGVIFDHCTVSPQELQEGADADLLGLRAHLRRARHDQPRRAASRPGARRLPLQREHRRLLGRQQHALQRLPAREDRAHQSVMSAAQFLELDVVDRTSSFSPASVIFNFLKKISIFAEYGGLGVVFIVMTGHDFAALIDSHGAGLVLFARQWCATPEDVVQEAMLKLVVQRAPAGCRGLAIPCSAQRSHRCRQKGAAAVPL